MENITSKTKSIVASMLLATLLIGFFIGFLVGQNIESTNSAVGTYKTDSWNGKSAALSLKKDGSCIYPTGETGTWSQDGDKITIVLGDYTCTADLVEQGIMLRGKFFEKLD